MNEFKETVTFVGVGLKRIASIEGRTVCDDKRRSCKSFPKEAVLIVACCKKVFSEWLWLAYIALMRT